MSEIPKAYEPKHVEQKWYKFWFEQGYFTPKIDKEKKPFVIIMPPPNVTGELHLGHALTATLEDIMTRWHRMKGEPSLWLPGVDHAGIATQVIVEQKLIEEGLDRHKLGREKFTERVWEWVARSRQSITLQHQLLGASCDWTREQFTLDEGPALAVRTAFQRLYKKGLIYQGERIINWCPRCQTALSDLEVQHKDITGNLYYLHYPLVDSDDYIVVATTRPETYLGDTAVAVNPEDKRFKKIIGQKIMLPIIQRVIPIIADNAIDPSFGTGLVKVTPAHDPVDFEISLRHKLPLINVLNSDATMNENAGPYKGLSRFDCRQRIIEDFSKDGLLDKIESHAHAVGHCDRCQTMVEPQVSKQWFVKTAPLAKVAIQAVNDSRIQIIPERFTKVYLNWMENIRDWCISRQLWWGHRIPVWYCNKCHEVIVSIDKPSCCPHCNAGDIIQDPDVLDTWFSSALWTHSTLGWPNNTEDLAYYYPTSVMETGYDILFFWVARMIMMGIEDTGEIPFRTVYLHGLVRDEKGEKMSKMRKNVLNPIVAIEKYGTDALRFAITTGTSPGNDVNVGNHKLEAGRNFANKIWNASRFVLHSIDSNPLNLNDSLASVAKQATAIEDRWIISQLNRLKQDVNQMLEEYQFGEAERKIFEYFWGSYCDWYIEIAKLRLSQKDSSALPLLTYILDTLLRLLHPFMPFITEELWQGLKQRLPQQFSNYSSIMIMPYTDIDTMQYDAEAERIMDAVIDIVRSIRNTRAERKVEATKWIEVQIFADELVSSISEHLTTIEILAKARPVTIQKRRKRQLHEEKALVMVLKESEIVIPWEGMVDQDIEKQRLGKEISILKREVQRLEQRLVDIDFISKAPDNVIEKERERLKSNKDKLQRLEHEQAQLI